MSLTKFVISCGSIDLMSNPSSAKSGTLLTTSPPDTTPQFDVNLYFF